MRWAWLAAAALVLAGCGGSALPAGKLYLSNVLNGTVTVLDAVSGEPVKKLKVGAFPHNFAFSRDRKTLFLTNTGSQSLSVIDTLSDTVVREIQLAPAPDNAPHRRLGGVAGHSCAECHHDVVGTQPAGIALAPDGEALVVASLKGATLTRVDPRTFAVGPAVTLRYPHQPLVSNVYFHPRRDEVYVLNRPVFKGKGRLTVMDRGLHVKRSFEVIKQPWGMVVSPDGEELFIASRGTNKVQVWDTRSWRLLRTLVTGNGPVAMFMSPEGKLYTANYYTNRPSYMSVLDPQSGRTLRRIETAADLTMFAMDPAGRYMYLANCGANKIQVIDRTTDAIVWEMHGGAFPLDVAFLPKGASGLQR